MKPLHVLQLVGSPTNDFYRDLSELYARGCLAALGESARYRFSIAHVSPDGTWRFPASLSATAIASAPLHSLVEAIGLIESLRIDVAIPQMFCTRGMTDMRGLLDVARIPYVGNRPLAMAIAADKRMARAIVAASGVDVPRARLARAGESVAFDGPVVVKPNNADNSDGVSYVANPSGLMSALADAFAHSETALVEDYVPLGREVRCGIVERHGEPICLPLEEYYVDSVTRPVRRRADKIKRSVGGDLTLAAKTHAESWIVANDDAIVAAVWKAARRCYVALGCRDYGLFDFRVDPGGRPWFLEAGLYCSFSPQSVVVTMMEANGVSLDRFFADSVEVAVVRGSHDSGEPQYVRSTSNAS